MKRRSALEGIKVVDFGTVGVGPMTTRYLADHGATVVRIESHTRPENQRLSRPYKDDIPGVNRSAVFTHHNSSKHSASIDLTKAKGREIGLRFIKWADVVSEGFSPGAMKRLGLDYEGARKVKPDIVYFSTSMLGQYGPHSKFKGFGQQAASLSGFYHLTGWPDRGPGGLYGAYTDWVNPRFAVATILSALDYRRRTGKGQFIDQSQVEAALHFLAPVLMNYDVNGHVEGRDGNHLSCAAPHGVYPCLGDDRWIAMAIFTQEEWEALCRCMNKPLLAQDATFASLKARKENEGKLDKLIGEWTSNFKAAELMSLLQAANIPVGIVQHIRDLFEDPQLIHRGHFRWLEHAEIGKHAYNALAFRLSKTPDCQKAAPTLGQDNEFVFKEILRMSEDEIAELLVERVITTDADLPEYYPRS